MPTISKTRERSRALGAQVARQLNEILLDVRKPFAMFGRTSWAVEEVGPDLVTVRLFHWPTDVSVVQTATNVRNAMLNLLRVTVPCAHFHAVFRRPDRSRAYRRVDLDFYPPGLADLPSQLVVIEENVELQRRHWRALVDRAAGSNAYFAHARAEVTS
jgi:hypothetical protein